LWQETVSFIMIVFQCFFMKVRQIKKKDEKKMLSHNYYVTRLSIINNSNARWCRIAFIDGILASLVLRYEKSIVSNCLILKQLRKKGYECFILLVLISVSANITRLLSQAFLIISSNIQVIEYACLECATRYKQRLWYVNSVW